MSATPDSNSDVLTAVLSRSETDVAFRQLLLTTPHTAIHDAFGVHIPVQLRLRFIERGSDVDALVVLPDLHVPVDELSDVELEHVTGGAQAHNAHLAWKGAAHGSSSHLI